VVLSNFLQRMIYLKIDSEEEGKLHKKDQLHADPFY